MKRLKVWKTAIVVMILLLPSLASSQETYKFERMWPTLKQPWYFNNPRGIAFDSTGFVYVVDEDNHSIQKYNSDGQFVIKWGAYGSDDGQFWSPADIAVDSNSFVYVADTYNDRIQKFTSDGQFVTKWGSRGTGDGQFDYHWGVAVDSNGFVYVVDGGANHRIQKFTSDGQFVTKWGSRGTGDGQFYNPNGITIDSSGFVYVADSDNHRIQKFTSDGQFVTKWGSRGTGDGQFDYPNDIATDSSGFVYVTDMSNRIQKFNSDGQFVTKWGPWVIGYGKFISPNAITIDSNGYMYVVDMAIRGIQKLTSDGQFVAMWGSYGVGEGQFNEPCGIVTDSSDFVYVVDRSNNRIQKFTSDGQFVEKWGSLGTGDGQFYSPYGIAINGSGLVYVADTNNDRIQKFTSDGQFVEKWGSFGTGDGQFYSPYGIAINGSGLVYVADTNNDRIQKFTSSGELVEKWGSMCRIRSDGFGCIDPDGAGPLEPGDGQFWLPSGVAVDNNGFVYVADMWNDRIQKFTPDGHFVTKWGSSCDVDYPGYEMDCIDPDGAGPLERGDGQFSVPSGISVDSGNFIYVTDTYNDRIQKFTSEGQFVTKWGRLGSEPGLFRYPSDLCISSTGKVYVSDSYNNRIQVFEEVNILTNPRAIIVAGRASADDSLWDSTQVCTNFAYRALTYQGYTESDIYYLSADTDLDLSGDGVPDVDANATLENLQYAITQWAINEGADSLVLYLNDHGGPDTFRLSETEILTAAQLNTWLDDLQSSISGTITVVYEACESGSFVDNLEDSDRIIVTSTLPGEQAKFLSQGNISFSSFFWTHIFNGMSIEEAYNNASQVVNFSFTNQNPQLSGDAENVYIGSGISGMIGEAPEIGSVSPPQEIDVIETADLYADEVIDADGIARVWAVIWPPNYDPGSSENPLLSLPTCELFPVGDNRFEGTYSQFTADGMYQIAIYAMDRANNTSIPKVTTVSRNYHLDRRVVIVAGASSETVTRSMIETNAGIAYDALKSQLYTDAEIYLMSVTTFRTEVDTGSYNSNLQSYLNSLANDAGIENLDLTIYLIGKGDTGTFTMNEDDPVPDILTASQLDGWLDSLQNTKPGRVVVVYDADKSGSVISLLTPPTNKERITITSSSGDGAAYFSPDGNVCFSSFFFGQVASGATIYNSFAHAKQAIAYLSRKKDISFSCYPMQSPILDADGDGNPNRMADYAIARARTIGIGLKFAADPPAIGSASVNEDEGEVRIRASNITATSKLQRVWAVIKPLAYCPGYSGEETQELTEVELDPDPAEEGSYEAIYTNPLSAFKATVYAMDADGATSAPQETKIYQAGGDVYEDPDRNGVFDDDPAEANVLVINYPSPQPHTFHYEGDEDWVKFYGKEGQVYTIEANNLNQNCPVIELYHEDDLTTPDWAVYDPPLEGSVKLPFPCTESSIYYARLLRGGCSWVADMSYELKVYDNFIGLTALVAGKVRDSVSGKAIDGAVITSNGIGATISTRGDYIFSEVPGSWTITSRKESYASSRDSIKIEADEEYVRNNIGMYPITSSGCATAADCDDGIFCNGSETCIGRICQPGIYPCPDDGIFCNGEEICSEENDTCNHSGNPCPATLICDEERDACVGCLEDSDCNDGLFCNGIETCLEGACRPGTYPCPEGVTCDEEADECELPTLSVIPQRIMQSHWIPIPVFMSIKGTYTHFSNASRVSFDPPSVMVLPMLINQETLLCMGLMMPAWITGALGESIEVSVTTGVEKATGSGEVGLMPFMLREEN